MVTPAENKKMAGNSLLSSKSEDRGCCSESGEHTRKRCRGSFRARSGLRPARGLLYRGHPGRLSHRRCGAALVRVFSVIKPGGRGLKLLL